MEKRDIIIGIGLGAIICAAGIVFAPAVPAGGLGATIISGGLAVGTTATLGTGGYAIAAGVLTGPPAALALVLMAGVVLVAWQVLRPFWASERPPAAKAAP
jgi:hypothetical protein